MGGPGSIPGGGVRNFNLYPGTGGGAKGDWDFRISDLIKNPDGTDI